MVYHNLIVNPVQVIRYLNLCGFPEHFILRVFIGKPYFPGPESIGPVHILNRLIKMIHAIGILEFIRKLRQIPFDLCGGKIQRLFDLLRADFLIIHRRFPLFFSHSADRLLMICRSAVFLCLHGYVAFIISPSGALCLPDISC